MLDLKSIDKDWTLFLDRDGVINDEVLGQYVLNWDEFHFSKNVLKFICGWENFKYSNSMNI